MVDLKEKLRDNKLTIGSWLTLGHPSIAEIMSKSGFDWLAVDMEHSVITLPECQQMIQVIESSGVAPLVRVTENNPGCIKRVMDAGAHGVIVPMVNTEEDALRAVAAVKYPPIGTRGVGLARAQGYGLEFEKYRDWVNKKSIVIVQIEHISAVKNLRQILSVKGVDGFMVGPYDLSASLGRPGDYQHPEVRVQLKDILHIAEEMNKTAGFYVTLPDINMLQEKIKEGYKFLCFGLDTLYLGTFCRDQMQKIKAKLKKA